jgi:hypothetical protein
MRIVIFGILGALLVIAQSGDSSATIYQFEGNFYEPVVADNITWWAAALAAQNQGGYLASVSNSAQNNFIEGLVSNPEYWTGTQPNGDYVGPWLGGFSFTSGVWNWVTQVNSSGIPITYTQWSASQYTDWYQGPPGATQPDGYGGYATGQAMQYYDYSVVGATWGDDPPNGTGEGSYLANGYIIEFNSLPGSVPEPTTLVVWSLLVGLGVTIGWWRRRKAA